MLVPFLFLPIILNAQKSTASTLFITVVAQINELSTEPLKKQFYCNLRLFCPQLRASFLVKQVCGTALPQHLQLLDKLVHIQDGWLTAPLADPSGTQGARSTLYFVSEYHRAAVTEDLSDCSIRLP
jgi:hypothetical protein